MTILEPFSYRSKKWALQQLTRRKTSDQLERLTSTDWDCLVVLDACRADTLQQVAEWPVDVAESPAGCTPEWLEKCVGSGILDDSHIVTGNIQYDKFDIDATVEAFWSSHWNDELNTVLPEPILDRMTELLRTESGPIVGHLQQPHWPYVAKLGNSWRLAYDDVGPWETPDGEVDAVQVAMARDLIDVKEAFRAYRASVRSVWQILVPYLDQWLDDSQTIIVTADHGELFGRFAELTLYEHPCRCHIRPLTTVPWIELRPQSTADQSGTVDDRLKALGYAE